MKIRELIVEAPLDSTGSVVGKGVGQGAYGAGYAAGKIASKFGSSQTPNTNQGRSANVLTAIGRGIKSGTMKWATGKGDDLSKDQNADTVRRIINRKSVPQDELDQLISSFPSLKLGWKVDRNAATLALNKYKKGQALDGNDVNSLKLVLQDLEEA